jgi:hypothetical protein
MSSSPDWQTGTRTNFVLTAFSAVHRMRSGHPADAPTPGPAVHWRRGVRYLLSLLPLPRPAFIAGRALPLSYRIRRGLRPVWGVCGIFASGYEGGTKGRAMSKKGKVYRIVVPPNA